MTKQVVLFGWALDTLAAREIEFTSNQLELQGHKMKKESAYFRNSLLGHLSNFLSNRKCNIGTGTLCLEPN